MIVKKLCIAKVAISQAFLHQVELKFNNFFRKFLKIKISIKQIAVFRTHGTNLREPDNITENIYAF